MGNDWTGDGWVAVVENFPWMKGILERGCSWLGLARTKGTAAVA
jgi:hypothetical protein